MEDKSLSNLTSAQKHQVKVTWAVPSWQVESYVIKVAETLTDESGRKDTKFSQLVPGKSYQVEVTDKRPDLELPSEAASNCVESSLGQAPE